VALLGQKGRRQHRKNGGAEEGLEAGGADQPGLASLPEEDEGELADLRQRDPDDDGNPEAMAEEDHRERPDHGLSDEDEGEEHRDEKGLLGQDARVEEHPDRDEEDGVECVPQRGNVGHGLVSVVRLGEDQARQEGSERRGQSGPGRGEGRRENQEENRNDEDFLLARARQGPDESRDGDSSRDDEDGGRDHHLAQSTEDRKEISRRLLRQDIDREQHGNDREVLDDQDPHEKPAVRRVEFPPVGQKLQDDGRRREGDEIPEEETAAGGVAGRGRDPHDEGDRSAQLDGPGDGRDLPQATQAAEGELEAHREEEEHDAELGQRFDGPDVADQSEAERAQQDAGGEIADERRLPEAMQEEGGAQSREEDQRERTQEFGSVHPPRLCGIRVVW
jgi:hypothetical protein